MYLDKKPIFHIVDAATTFLTGQFLNNVLTKKTWKTLRQYWINTYFSPSDGITYNTIINFDTTKLWAKTKILCIT